MRRRLDLAKGNDGGGRRARWRSPAWPVLCCIALLSPWPLAASLAQTPNYPPDFTLVAMAGGVSPETSLRIVVVDSTGAGESCLKRPDDRGAGTCTSTSPLSLTVAQLNSIWDAVDGNGFFTLPAEFLSNQFADGSFARLAITAGGTTHTVTTQNVAVAAFDSTILALNAVLPPGSRLVYNELAP